MDQARDPVPSEAASVRRSKQHSRMSSHEPMSQASSHIMTPQSETSSSVAMTGRRGKTRSLADRARIACAAIQEGQYPLGINTFDLRLRQEHTEMSYLDAILRGQGPMTSINPMGRMTAHGNHTMANEITTASHRQGLHLDLGSQPPCPALPEWVLTDILPKGHGVRRRTQVPLTG